MDGSFTKLTGRIDSTLNSRRCLAVSVLDFKGRIIYGNDQGDVFRSYEPQVERIADMREVVALRTLAFSFLPIARAHLFTDFADALKTNDFQLLESIGHEVRTITKQEPELFSIWRYRLTTQTHMVRVQGTDGTDKMAFYHGDPFSSREKLIEATEGPLSDGGVYYGREAIARIMAETPPHLKVPYDSYLAARGGNFSGPDFSAHPIFSIPCGKDTWASYVAALQFFSVFDSYHELIHSGWLPGNMGLNHGRFISLGVKGEAFYPVNGSTRGHFALVLPKDTRIPLTPQAPQPESS